MAPAGRYDRPAPVAAIVIEGVGKAYCGAVAVDDVSFSVALGEIFGLLGPNGAGKTRTLECLEGLRTPTTGTLQPAAATLLHLTLVAAVITATAPLIFRAPLPANGLAYVGVFLAAGFAHASLGLLIAVISPSTRATILWSQLVFLPSVLLGGLMVPAEAITGALAQLSKLLPAAHGMNAMHGLAYAGATPYSATASLLVLLVGGAVALALAIVLFQWDRKADGRRVHPGSAVLALVPYLVGVLLR